MGEFLFPIFRQEDREEAQRLAKPDAEWTQLDLCEHHIYLMGREASELGFGPEYEALLTRIQATTEEAEAIRSGL